VVAVSLGEQNPSPQTAETQSSGHDAADSVDEHTPSPQDAQSCGHVAAVSPVEHT